MIASDCLSALPSLGIGDGEEGLRLVLFQDEPGGVAGGLAHLADQLT